jgi:hypothetical protein
MSRVQHRPPPKAFPSGMVRPEGWSVPEDPGWIGPWLADHWSQPVVCIELVPHFQIWTKSHKILLNRWTAMF